MMIFCREGGESSEFGNTAPMVKTEFGKITKQRNSQ